jgi:hypothetical protein
MIIENPIKDDPKGPFQEGAAPALTDNPHLRRMSAEMTGTPTRPANGRPVMAANAEIRPPAVVPGARIMEPFKPPADRQQGATPSGEMKARPEPADQAGQGYLRFRVRVTDNRMRIVGAQAVDGPLALSPSFVGEHAYEVTLDARPIALEGLPDLGVSRSYPRPDYHEHHITARPTYEFNVRVPRSLAEDRGRVCGQAVRATSQRRRGDRGRPRGIRRSAGARATEAVVPVGIRPAEIAAG